MSTPALSREASADARLVVLAIDAPVLTVSVIIKLAAAVWAVTPTEIVSQLRAAPIVEARHCVMWVARMTLPYSLPQIGRAIGGRDHTTVMHALQRVERRRGRDAAFAARVSAVLQAATRIAELTNTGEPA